jgi:hypothetical protein
MQGGGAEDFTTEHEEAGLNGNSKKKVGQRDHKETLIF